MLEVTACSSTNDIIFIYSHCSEWTDREKIFTLSRVPKELNIMQFLFFCQLFLLFSGLIIGPFRCNLTEPHKPQEINISKSCMKIII